MAGGPEDSTLSSSPPGSLDVERGTVRVGVKTALAVVVGLVTATVGGVTAWGQLASKAELADQAVLVKGFALDAKAKAEAAQRTADANALKLEQLRRIDGRLDFLVEAQLEAARTSKRSHKAAATAMRKVRARALAEGQPDPIADLQL